MASTAPAIQVTPPGIQVPAPQNIGEVEWLVKQLYQPGVPPAVITQINEQLQKIQHSDEAWQVADTLLASEDSNVQFFGALCFTVKLNNDGPSLDESTANSVLFRLISWLVKYSQEAHRYVAKKLCSTLTTYFIRSPVPWSEPLRQLMLSLQHGGPISAEDVAESTLTPIEILDRLQPASRILLLWVSSTLADEVGRLDIRNKANIRVQDSMEEVVEDACALIYSGLLYNPDPKDATEIRRESLKSFLAWVNYAQPVWPRRPEILQHLRNLIEPALSCIVDSKLQKDTLDIFRDILEGYTSFFPPTHMHLLAEAIHMHVRPGLFQGLRQLDPEALPYGQLIIAYGIANIQNVVEHPDDVYQSETIIDLHFAILRAEGYPGDEDELSIESTEFWNTYVEYINEGREGDPNPPWLDHAKKVLTELVALLWRKMMTPPPEVAKSWSEEENDGFRSFRMDAKDLMLSIHQCLGRSMLEILVGYVLRSLQAKNWRAVEAALFALDALADAVLEPLSEDDFQPPQGDDLLYAVFSSSLFRDIADFSQPISISVRRTAMDVIGSYGEYVQRHAEFLPDAVRFLFASLDTPLCNTAAKSIAALCGTCREKLTGELTGFLEQIKILPWAATESYAKEKVLEGVSCIIQALPSDAAKAHPLMELLGNIEQEIEATRGYAESNNLEAVELHGVSALKCLASIGKGLQVPTDVPIDVDKQAQQSNFWRDGEGQAVQQRIMNCFTVLQYLANSGEAIDSACTVLRSGFAETEPGPFVLPPSFTVSFLQQCSLSTPQLEAVIDAALTLVAGHTRHGTVRIDAEVLAIYQKIATFIKEMKGPSDDPSVSTSCIDLFWKLTGSYASIVFDSSQERMESLQNILDFTLKAIEGPDFFPKRSALQMWAQLMKTQPSAAGKLGDTTQTDEVRSVTAQAIAAYGPRLAGVLMRQVGGQAARSELDVICEPLKAMLLTQPSSRSWLETALLDPEFPTTSKDVGEAEKKKFVQQLAAVRGETRKMKELVTGFYADCRGTIRSFGGP